MKAAKPIDPAALAEVWDRLAETHDELTKRAELRGEKKLAAAQKKASASAHQTSLFFARCAFWISGWDRAVRKLETKKEMFLGRETITWACAGASSRWLTATKRMEAEAARRQAAKFREEAEK